MTTLYRFISVILILLYWILIASVTVRIFMKRRAVQSSMAWLLIVYILPLFGVITYFILGELYLGKTREKRARIMWPSIRQWLNDFTNCSAILALKKSDVARSLFQLCELRQGIASVKGNQLHLLTSTDDTLQAIIRDIKLARNNIKMVFYIWQPGGMANTVANELITAAQRGVTCRIMLDSAGSRAFFRSPFASLMRHAGIEVVEALHVNLLRIFFRRLDLRQHRKMVLIDNNIAYTGSMNLVDPRFFRQKAGVGQWIDLMVRMEGPVAYLMAIIYSCDWEWETGQRILPPLPHLLSTLKNDTTEQAIQVIASGPGPYFPKDMIHQALLTAIFAAREAIIMTTPYFVPSDDLLQAICIAAQRGVDVSIIIPRSNDSLLVGWACRSFFTELLEAGVKIYQFEGGLLHTKSVHIDGQLSLLGTVNLDMRSLWLNLEITIVIDDNYFSKNLFFIQKNYLNHSRLIDVHQWRLRPLWHRILERLCYFWSPLL
ncbi:MAG: cardiolipin synthase [Candidatus Dasytiphilus stammeri]